METLNPFKLALMGSRKMFEFLAKKPKYQWTLGNNPLLGEKKFATIPFSRPARIAERLFFLGWGGAATLVALPTLLVMGPVAAVSLLAAPLFVAKVGAVSLGLLVEGGVRTGELLSQIFDQIFNGPDEMRPRKQAKPGKGASVSPTMQPQHEGPSIMDKMIKLGNMFNGRAGQTRNNPFGNTVIWGDPTPQQQQGTTNTYEEAFKVPEEGQIRIASSGRESVAQHEMHYGNPPPTHHHAPEPPPPVYKPPGCDNN